MLGEATLDVSGTFLGEAIRLPIQIAAQQETARALRLRSLQGENRTNARPIYETVRARRRGRRVCPITASTIQPASTVQIGAATTDS
jgi:hypothetical protein